MEKKQGRHWTKEELAAAIRRNQFIPFFQPKIDLATGISSCVEILARWDHPELGILPPSQFISRIESEGLIDQFTYSLLRHALERGSDNFAKVREVGMAINVSWLTLQDPQFPYRICTLVSEYGFSFERITLEVTESAIPISYSAAIESLSMLRALGFKISIDDFGTGYSSLKLLSKAPFTELKIDKMFIADIPENRKLTEILEAIVHLAKKLGLRIVAEGIETKKQLDVVRTLGCNVAQGFYFGNAMKNIGAAIMNRREQVGL